MKNIPLKIVVLMCAALFAGAAYAGPTPHSTAAPIQASPDPKKKKLGEECVSATECQAYHICLKTGEKSICTNPPLPPSNRVMPPT